MFAAPPAAGLRWKFKGKPHRLCNFGHSVRRKGLMGTFLQVKDLKIGYRSADSAPWQAVDGVNFDIAPGEIAGSDGRVWLRQDEHCAGHAWLAL